MVILIFQTMRYHRLSSYGVLYVLDKMKAGSKLQFSEKHVYPDLKYNSTAT